MFNTRVVRDHAGAMSCSNGPDGRSRGAGRRGAAADRLPLGPVLLRERRRGDGSGDGAPVHDEQTFETTVPGLFVIGAFVAGKQSGRIFIENGRFHGEVVIAEIERTIANRSERSGT